MSKKTKTYFMEYLLLFIIIAGGYFSFLFLKKKTKLPVLRLNIRKEPKTLDPRKSADLYSFQMHFLLFEGLVKMYPDQSIRLAQAESYQVSDDHLTYTFTLRDTVWSDNTPVTAYDFEQTWKDILRPDFPSTNDYLFSPIKNADAVKKGLVSLDELGVKALDAKTLVITLEKPTPYLFKLLSFCAFFPINIENARTHPNWSKKVGPHFLCNGPFVLEKWIHEKQIIVARNPNYRKTKDLHAEKIVFNIVEDDTESVQMFKQGLIDIIGDCLTDIPLEEISALEKKWTISRAPKGSTVFININTEKFPFNHPKIRKAFSFAINRQELISLTGNGVKKSLLKYDQSQAESINTAYQACCAATNMVPPCLKENRYHSFFQDNDVNQAKLLLEEGLHELGITKEIFNSVVLYYSQRYPEKSSLVDVIQQQWLKALGIFIKLESLDFNLMMDKLIQGNYSMALMRRNPSYPDPMSILERFKYKSYATNFSNWENQKYIELLNRSFYEQEDKRLLTLKTAEKIFINEMPVIPLYHEDYVYIVNPRLPFTIPIWWRDRILLPLSTEEQKTQKENRYAHSSKN